jgi:hypothetical protein
MARNDYKRIPKRMACCEGLESNSLWEMAFYVRQRTYLTM